MAVRPVPASDTICGLPDALSVTVRVPWRVPPAAGVKVTLIEQLAPAASALEQLLVWEKSPVAVMAEMARGPSPVLERVTVCPGLEDPTACPLKNKLAGARAATGMPPVPVRERVWGFCGALSRRVMPPVKVPVEAGAKVTLMEQLAPAGTVPPQLSVSENGALLERER